MNSLKHRKLGNMESSTPCGPCGVRILWGLTVRNKILICRNACEGFMNTSDKVLIRNDCEI